MKTKHIGRAFFPIYVSFEPRILSLILPIYEFIILRMYRDPHVRAFCFLGVKFPTLVLSFSMTASRYCIFIELLHTDVWEEPREGETGAASGWSLRVTIVVKYDEI